MGVCSVLRLPVDQGIDPQKMLESYIKKIESIGGQKDGTYTVDCESYLFNENILGIQDIRYLHHIQSSEHPASSFSFIEHGQPLINRQIATSVVTDAGFDRVIRSLSNFYQHKQFHDTKVAGTRLTYRDFLIKIGVCSLKSQFRAILCEVEYTPSPFPCDSIEIIKDLFQIIIGTSHPFDIHTFLAPHMKEKFTPFLAMHQYYEIFIQIKHQTHIAEQKALEKQQNQQEMK